MTGEYVLRLPFARPPVTANEARSTAHWSKQHAAKVDVTEAVVRMIEADGVPPLDRVAVTLVWYSPDHGVRDCDGLYPMLKAVLDALTPPRPAIPKGAPTKAGTPRKKPQAAKLGAGIIPDDRAEIVASTTCRIVQADPDPRIELHLLALDPLEGWAPPTPPTPRTPKVPKQREPRTVRERTHAALVPAAQPSDGGSAWRARVEAARRRHG